MPQPAFCLRWRWALFRQLEALGHHPPKTFCWAIPDSASSLGCATSRVVSLKDAAGWWQPRGALMQAAPLGRRPWWRWRRVEAEVLPLLTGGGVEIAGP